MSTVESSLGEAFAGLFPTHIRVQSGRIDDWQGELLPEEMACLSQAVEKRRKEFTASRVLARRILESFGFQGFPVVPDERRCPCWPAGIVGSIAHTSEWCVVAIGCSTEVKSIGLDMESIDRVTPQLWDKILVKSERNWIERQPESDQVRWATTVFSAKEAYYKFQYPQTKRWLGFEDVEILFEGEQDITARRIGGELQAGRQIRCADSVLTGFW